MYERGEGVPKDLAEAMKWYRFAAEQDFSPAQYRFGLANANGDGVPKDEVEAYTWINLAAKAGVAEAADVRRLLESRMTATQIAEAQQRCLEFRPTKMPPMWR